MDLGFFGNILGIAEVYGMHFSKKMIIENRPR